jgi:hypothetical protein
MPRSIILRPPGGASGVKRRCYTAREKIAITSKICHIKQETNVSYCQAAALIDVSHTFVFRWHAIRECFNNIDIKKLPRYSAYPCHCGQLESMKEELLAWIFERREKGLLVSTLSVIIKACCLLPLMEQIGPCALFCDASLLEKTLDCVPHGNKGVAASPPHELC